MPNATDQRVVQPSPALPEPSYARQVIDRITELLTLAKPDSLVSSIGLRRVFTVAVAEQVTLLNLPDAVANTVTERVDRLLPPVAPDTTVEAYTGLLRTLARTV